MNKSNKVQWFLSGPHASCFYWVNDNVEDTQDFKKFIEAVIRVNCLFFDSCDPDDYTLTKLD